MIPIMSFVFIIALVFLQNGVIHFVGMSLSLVTGLDGTYFAVCVAYSSVLFFVVFSLHFPFTDGWDLAFLYHLTSF